MIRKDKVLTVFLLAGTIIPAMVMLTKVFPADVEKAEKFFAEGNLKEAVKCWEQQERIHPSPDLYEKISSCYLLLGDKKQARVWLEKGLINFARCGNLMFNMALLDYSEQRYESALALVDKLIKQNPYFPEVYYLKGCILQAQGKEEEARKQFVEEVNHNPGSKRTWQKLKEFKNEKK